MDIGIVGLPRSGKTTIFNAVTRGSIDVSTFGASQAKPNMGVAK
ncbi:MAG: 50S ribosome-binding GTPase, partial [Chloroflexi bacterium]|nr:50S ribosome-binding GTPase [Chloroflexota bacterium]